MATTRKRYCQRLEALRAERSTWIQHWRELSDNIQPRRGRFLSTDRNRGGSRNGNVINGTPKWAARTQASGMMAGITSPARPWFLITTVDPAMAEVGSVRSWLHTVQELIREALQKSNVYKCLHKVYGDLGTPGTAALIIEEDAKTTIRGFVIPIGQYCLASNASGEIDTIYREFSMTVAQLVEMFGEEKCSQNVRDMRDRGQVDEWIEVIHAIEPNTDYTHGVVGPKGKLFRSCWMEKNGSDDVGFLRESGYEEFPAMCPRWETDGEDVYGSSPGMDALGDAKALQLLEKRKAQLIDKITNPPMKAPTSLMNTKVSLLPGDVTFVDQVHAGQAFGPAMEIDAAAITVIGAEIQRHEMRVNKAYFADLWVMMIESEGRDITAREVVERHEEKMIQLGPVLEALQVELLKPLIDRVYAILLRAGMIPPPPEEIQGQELRIEYTSIMAQAQKLLGTTAIERLANFAMALAKGSPEVLDKLNMDEFIDTYADSLGVKPDLVRPDDVVAQIRQRRAQEQAAQKQGEAALAAAQGAQSLSQAKLSDDNALTRMMAALGGPTPNVPGGTA